ncbi:MAG: hypothetical protein QME51_11305 [Planctomycetota bacterium]|nr:hypothetical protein [Planctomycetota bacterium]
MATTSLRKGSRDIVPFPSRISGKGSRNIVPFPPRISGKVSKNIANNPVPIKVNKTILLVIVFFLHLVAVVVYAHHEHLVAPEREYLKTIALHPFKDKLIRSGDYGFYISVSEPSPQSNYVDLIFYIEHLLLKRPLRFPKEIIITSPRGMIEGQKPQQFILETDITGVSALRYIFSESFPANIKISTQTQDNQSISVETDITIGSPKPSLILIGSFILIMMIAIISIYFINKIVKKTL